MNGQLELFSPPADQPAPEPAPTPAKKQKRRKQNRRVTWVGAASCRSCGHRFPVYRKARRYWAWSQPDLVPDCPGCGVAVTTTTFELRKEAA